MPQGREAPLYLLQPLRIDLRRNDSFRIALQLRNDLPPWIDDHAVPPGVPSSGVSPELGRSQNVRLVFDGPRSQQDFPMRPARRDGEGGRDGENPAPLAGVVAVEFRKPQVLSDAQTDPPLFHLDDEGAGSGFDEI